MLLAKDLHHVFYYQPWIKHQEYLATRKLPKEKEGQGFCKTEDLPLSSEPLTESKLLDLVRSPELSEELDDELQVSEKVQLSEAEAPPNCDDRRNLLVFFDAFVNGQADTLREMPCFLMALKKSQKKMKFQKK